MAMIRNLSAL